MDDFLAVLEKDPAQLSGLAVQPETWRGPTPPSSAEALLEPAEPMSKLARKLKRLRAIAERARTSSVVAAAAAVASNGTQSAATPAPSLKLYQPAHQRYYLVTSTLVCNIAGLPDRRVDPGLQERATFVVRRLFPLGGPPQPGAAFPSCDPETCEEYAFVTSPSGSGWQRIPKTSPNSAAVLIPGEEQLPLFAVRFMEDSGRQRRLFSGMVPVGKREAYMGAATRPLAGEMLSGSSERKVDPRMILVWSQISDPWKALIERAAAVKKMQTGLSGDIPTPSTDEPLTGDALTTSLKVSREQIQTVSWYILLDFANFLKQYLPDVWLDLSGQPLTRALTANETALVTALTNTSIGSQLVNDLRNTHYPDANVLRSLREALVAIKGGAPFNQDFESRLEAVTTPYNRDLATAVAAWPPFLFPLADPVRTGPLPPGSGTPNARIDALWNLIEAALPSVSAERKPQAPLVTQPVMDTRDGWFVIRCVFERPNCGPLEPAVVSQPTQPFQLAGFFDPDAPARPIRIGLPIDTSPAGLRKFDKNTAFMISDVLCGQIDRMKGLTLGDLVRSVLPWPLHKDLSVPEKGPCTDAGGNAGMMCSISIPIVTICALILLMIIVNLLDIIFRWVPFFIQCFPLPGFKAKK